MPKVTCLQHAECEGPGYLADVFKSKHVEMEIVRLDQGQTIPSKLGDGLVVLGGPMSAYEEAKHPWLNTELQTLRKALDLSLPVLGICLGSQMLAKAAGAQVYQGAQLEVGWEPIFLKPAAKSDPLFAGLPDEIKIFHWHGDSFTLPPDSQLLASSQTYARQVYRLGDNAYGFQCHFEVTEAMVLNWMEVYKSDLTPQEGFVPPEKLNKNLAENIRNLQSVAEPIFTRFASLL